MIAVRRRTFRAVAALQAAATAAWIVVHRLAESARSELSGDAIGDFEAWSYWNGWLGLLFFLAAGLWAVAIAAARGSPPEKAGGLGARPLAFAYAIGVPLVVIALVCAGL